MIQLWNRFQADAADRLYAATGKRTPIVLWTSRLTEKATFVFFVDLVMYIFGKISKQKVVSQKRWLMQLYLGRKHEKGEEKKMVKNKEQ